MTPAAAVKLGRSRAAKRSRAKKADLRLRKWSLIFLILAAAAVTGFLWLRDSSLVAVKKVEISGVPKNEQADIVPALRSAAEGMTTLHIDQAAFEKIKQRFPSIASIETSISLPGTLKIEIVEHNAVAFVRGLAGGKVAVSEDGALLKGVELKGKVLPSVHLSGSVVEGRVSGRNARALVSLLSAAPESLRAKIKLAFIGPRGLTAVMRRGSRIYFGTGLRPRKQWLVVRRILADPSTGGAKYIDVTIASRPAVGGLAATTAGQPGAPGQPVAPAAAAPGTTSPPATTAAPTPVQPAQAAPGAVAAPQSQAQPQAAPPQQAAPQTAKPQPQAATPTPTGGAVAQP